MLKRTAVVLTAVLTLGAGIAYADPQTKRVQRKLGIPADGIAGPQTKRAVKRFQRARGLIVDGIIGPQTLRALGISVRRKSPRASIAVTPVLARIAECESGGNPRAVSSNGMYRGKYQFSRETWRAMGGKGDPAKAPERVQDRLALKLYRQSGTAPWPTCGA